MSLSPSLFLTIDPLTPTLRGQVSCKHITASKYMFVSPVLYVHEQTGVDGLKVHVGSYYYFWTICLKDTNIFSIYQLGGGG